MFYTQLKKVLLTFVLLFSVIGVLACTNFTTRTYTFTPTPNNVGNFEDYDAVKAYLSQFYEKSGDMYQSKFFNRTSLMSPGAVQSEMDTTANSGPRNYSQTNNQVEGVQESDLFLTNGYTLFMIQNNKFRIVDVDSLTKTFEYSIDQGYMHGMYYDAVANQVILITYTYIYETPKQTEDESVDMWRYWYFYKTQTNVIIFDVEDTSEVVIVRELEFDNTYMVQSRMIDGMLYLVLDNYQINYAFNEDNFIPIYRDSEVSDDNISLPASSIFFMPNGNDSLGFLMLVSLDTRSDDAVDVKAYIGSSYQIYMSLYNLYTVVYRYDYNSETNEYRYYTNILRFEIQADKTLAFKAIAKVDGSPLNQFSIDEYDGVLRIATTHRVWTQNTNTVSNQVYLLDATTSEIMTQLSMLGGLGKPGESIFAVRFNGVEGFVVTFVNTDPLYKISLADPYNPFVISAYEEPGVSDYLHIINQDLILGVGRNAVTTDGWTRFTGVKVSLYNKSGTETILKANYLVEGTYSYTNVQYDHKAFIYYPRLDLGVVYFAIPVFEYTNSPEQAYYYNYSQSLYVFQINLSEETIDFVGKISHLTPIDNPYYWRWFDSVERAVMIEDRVYTISQTQIRVHQIGEGLLPVGSLILEVPNDGRPAVEDSSK